MKIRYSYALLKYVHDAITGEFAIVGVMLYAHDVPHVAFKASPVYGRLSEFFPGMDGDHFRRMMRSIQARADEFSTTASGLFHKAIDEKAALELGNRILPLDDSSLQFYEGGSGVASDLASTLDRIYERYVERYTKKLQHHRRSDEMVLNSLRPLLERRKLLDKIEPITIVAKDYEHSFPIAWMNGKLNTCEAISFDYTESSRVLEKATTWLGRGVTLNESPEKFTLHLLVGKPRDPKLRSSYQKALNILHKMPLDHELVSEEEAPKFVEDIAKDLSH